MPGDRLSHYAAAGIYTKQGRLAPPVEGLFQSFPRHTWENELGRLNGMPGIRGIEWMHDLHGTGFNPLETPQGRQRMREQLQSANIALASVCADYFMDCPLVRCDESQRHERLAHLAWLIGVCPEVGIRRIVLPLLDGSSIQTPQEREIIIECLRQVLPLAQEKNVTLNLETDLPPQALRVLLLELNHPMIKVNYDTGNSAAAGFDPREEFAAYGAWIGSVHVKDRRRGGPTVPLGEGDVNFPLLRELLLETGYQGDFVTEAARGGEPGREIEWQSRMAMRAVRWLRGEALIPDEAAA